MTHYSFVLAGAQHRPHAAQLRCHDLFDNEALRIEPEPDNKYDPFAHKVITTDNVFIGYVPKKIARNLATVDIVRANVQATSGLLPHIHVETTDGEVA